MKIYKDSKEFPLYNYERIESTNNYFYMIKGYEDGDKVEAKIDTIVILFFSENRALAGCIEKDEEQENSYYFIDPLGDIIEEETWGWPRYWMEVPKLPE